MGYLSAFKCLFHKLTKFIYFLPLCGKNSFSASADCTPLDPDKRFPS